MGVLLAKTACFVLVFLSAIAVIKVTGRTLRYGSSELVSDGFDHHANDNISSHLVFRGLMVDESTENCEHMYGFLPCADSLLGHLFLIVVYEYLLFHGDSYVASGGERIFKILGPGVFGASAFQIICALPESLILLASGLLSDNEKAQDYASTGLGLLAGTTIFLLTVVWGTCIIVGSSQKSSNLNSYSSNSSTSSRSKIKTLLSKTNDFCVTTDEETSYTARIMVLSVIPFLIILIPEIFQISYSKEHIIIFIALIVSTIFLLSYFFYQMFEPWIQDRQLEYVKHERLVVDILKHVQRNTVGKLINEDGRPNVPSIKRLFLEVDQDRNNFISFDELKELLREIRFRNSNWDKDKKIAEVMKEFDLNGDKNVTMDEFVKVFSKWLDDTKSTMDKRYHSVNSMKDLYQILQPWIQNRKKEHEMKKELVSQIVGHVQSSALGSLYTEDGTPDIHAIKKLFQNTDLDKDNSISQEELKKLIIQVNFGKIPWDADEMVGKMMEQLDVNGDQVINEEEFISGFLKWLNGDGSPSPSSSGPGNIYQKKSAETTLLKEKATNTSLWEWTKAIALLVLGIVMLALLAEPLIESVHSLSTSADIPPSFVAFVLVPLATNARVAISAIRSASRKIPRTTSLTLSEIYGGVFMNNVLGFSVLLSIVYFYNLSWHFSAQLFIVLFVSVVTGFTASFNSTFPVWKSFVAYLLYPLSMLACLCVA
ncbi:putative sodium/calcium exchanger membrane region, EF-hand domain pair [Heracleum sosnowskyi]|uniref:Sodium/calcium exchanger membrane region, EF-hand domain pair n=1 Tax=Heracleum sosnowskyi TaxID=360622 RepID=A0AAD8IQV7_9APIA|nr:putative sodium/calcium exchanger membrane region, EF-hand domain pair [Heracleum sosnowskyi]